MNLRSPLALALGLSIAALYGCGGSSSGGGPAPMAAATPASATLAAATRGTLQLTLDALRMDQSFARFVRPGVGTILQRPSTQFGPTCSAGTASRSTGTTLTTAFYPVGDTTCSHSPTRILVVDYSGVSSTHIAYGYQVAYAQGNDPTVTPGLVADYEQFEAALYDTAPGHEAFEVGDVQSMSTSNAGIPQSAPGPGKFPATFPVGLPTPLRTALFANFDFAVDQSGGSARAGTLSIGNSFVNPFAVVNNLQSVGVNVRDAFTVSASAPNARGQVTLTWSASGPAYAIDPTADEPSFVLPFLLGANDVSWPLPPVGVLGFATSQLNFSGTTVGSATYGPDGGLIACNHTVTDTSNAVAAKAACVNGGQAIELGVTDLHASASAIKPAKVVLDEWGNGRNAGLASALSYTVLFDGSQDQINAFSVLPAL